MTDPIPPAVSDAMREAVATYRQYCAQVFRQLKEDEIWLIEGFAFGPIASEIARLTGERDAARAEIEAVKEWAGEREGWPDLKTKCEALTSGALRAEADAEAAEAETARLRTDAERFRALMRCPRIAMQGSAGVDPDTGERRDPERPGGVHFGAEFWPTSEEEPDRFTIWGRRCLRALADDILAFEARAALSSQDQADV